jgi:peptidoglycan/LPS O-acetylase OafA/YrhL
MNAPKSRLYFPGLNALRFIAASLVVLAHVEVLKAHTGITAGIPDTHGLRERIGALAVKFFFVLSGYLITYLLFVERERFGTISIRNFYVRRILRIWPLYYAVIVVGVFVLRPLLPPVDYAETAFFPSSLGLYIGFIPNVAAALGRDIPYIDHLWSIGVEEQFYLLWPVLVAWAKDRRIFWVLLGIVIAFSFGQVGAFELQARTALAPSIKATLNTIRYLLLATPLSCMGIGGLGAYALYYWPQRTKQLVSYRLLEPAVLVLIVGLYFTGPTFYGFANEVFSVLFCYLILSISTAERSFLRMEGPRWTHLGNISYGIYGSHWIVLAALGWGLTACGIRANGWLANTLLYGLSLPAAVGLASLSYRYFESYFIQQKERFQLVRSGTEAEPSSPQAPSETLSAPSIRS